MSLAEVRASVVPENLATPENRATPQNLAVSEVRLRFHPVADVRTGDLVGVHAVPLSPAAVPPTVMFQAAARVANWREGQGRSAPWLEVLLPAGHVTPASLAVRAGGGVFDLPAGALGLLVPPGASRPGTATPAPVVADVTEVRSRGLRCSAVVVDGDDASLWLAAGVDSVVVAADRGDRDSVVSAARRHRRSVHVTGVRSSQALGVLRRLGVDLVSGPAVGPVLAEHEVDEYLTGGYRGLTTCRVSIRSVSASGGRTMPTSSNQAPTSSTGRPKRLV